MSTVTEIEHASETLPLDEYAKLLFWLHERQAIQVGADLEAAVLGRRRLTKRTTTESGLLEDHQSQTPQNRAI